MARYRRRRYYKRKSGRWAPNIVKISNRLLASPGEFYASEDLALNPLQTNTGVSQTFTVKNFELTFTIDQHESALQNLSSITAYVMFVPQGMQVTSSYYADHPEYIMAYKYLGAPDGQFTVVDPNIQSADLLTSQQYQPIRIRTRLSRKLHKVSFHQLYIHDQE